MSRPPHPGHLRTSISSINSHDSRSSLSPVTPIITISPSSGPSELAYFDQDQHQECATNPNQGTNARPSEQTQGGVVFHTPVYEPQNDTATPAIETEAKTETIPCVPGIRPEFWDLSREDLERRIYDREYKACLENEIQNDLERQMNWCGLTKHDKTLLHLNAGAKKTSLQWSADHQDPSKWSIPDESGEPQLVINQFDKFGVIAESVFIVSCGYMTQKDKYVNFANELVTSCHTRGSSMNRQLGLIEGKVRAFELREEERRLAHEESQARTRQDSGQSSIGSAMGDLPQEERGRKRSTSYSRWMNRYVPPHQEGEDGSPRSSKDFLSIDKEIETGSYSAQARDVSHSRSQSRFRRYLRSALDHSRSPSSSLRRKLSGSRRPSEKRMETTSKLVESALNSTKEISEGRKKVQEYQVREVGGLRVLIGALRGD